MTVGGTYVGKPILEHSRQADISLQAARILDGGAKMRPPKAITWLVIGIALPQMTGCASFKHYEGELPITAEGDNFGDRSLFRVTTRHGMRMELVLVSKRGQEIRGQLQGKDVFEALQVYGEPGSNWVSIPMTEVVEIEREGIDVLRSTPLIIGVACVLGSIIGIYGVLHITDTNSR